MSKHDNDNEKKISALCFYVANIFLLGCFISPILWIIIHSTSLKLIDSIGQAHFGKVCNRAFMIVAFIGLFPLLKQLQCRTKNDFGLNISKKNFFKEFSYGFLLGTVSLIILAYFYYAINLRVIRHGDLTTRLIQGLYSGICTGITVAFIEEVFFRGILIRLLSKCTSITTSILVSSIAYSTVHFIKGNSSIKYQEIHWYSGFAYLSHSYSLFLNPRFIGSFLTLFTIGVFLAKISLFRKNIAACIGIHAGWICILKATAKTTHCLKDSPYYWLVGNYDNFTGYGSFIWLIIVCLSVWFFLQKRDFKDKISSPTLTKARTQ